MSTYTSVGVQFDKLQFNIKRSFVDSILQVFDFAQDSKFKPKKQEAYTQGMEKYIGEFAGFVVFAYINSSPSSTLYEKILLESKQLKICKPYNCCKNQSFGEIKIQVDPKFKAFLKLAINSSENGQYSYKTKISVVVDESISEAQLIKLLLEPKNKNVKKKQREKKEFYIYSYLYGN